MSLEREKPTVWGAAETESKRSRRVSNHDERFEMKRCGFTPPRVWDGNNGEAAIFGLLVDQGMERFPGQEAFWCFHQCQNVFWSYPLYCRKGGLDSKGSLMFRAGLIYRNLEMALLAVSRRQGNKKRPQPGNKKVYSRREVRVAKNARSRVTKMSHSRREVTTWRCGKKRPQPGNKM
jgi:hypothetical protein